MKIFIERDEKGNAASVFLSLLLLAVIFSCPIAGATGVSLIKDEYRTCKLDQDCALVLLHCQCMYCARPGDKDSGIADAVNGKYSDQVKDLGKCSPADFKHCAMAGPCAVTGTSVPSCQAGKCTIVYKERSVN